MAEAGIQALASDALRLWGGGTAPRLIANRENAVFHTVLSDGTPAALRLHRAGYQTDAAIESELIWTDALAAAGFPCPRPIRTADGALLGCPAVGPRVSVIAWIDTLPVGRAGIPAAGTIAQQCELYHTIGAMIARLHRLSDGLTLPAGFQRPQWDLDGLTGDLPHWGRFWENPALNGKESDRLVHVRDIARAHLRDGAWDTGLIHADLLQENILGSAEHLSLIDFDDGGFGYRLYDLGTAMVQHAEAPHFDDLSAALCDGYGGGHADLPLFTLLRACASTGWLIPRLPPDDPRHRSYADRALRLAHRYCG